MSPVSECARLLTHTTAYVAHATLSVSLVHNPSKLNETTLSLGWGHGDEGWGVACSTIGSSGRCIFIDTDASRGNTVKEWQTYNVFGAARCAWEAPSGETK
eukprot:5507235-Amphidinium_carterae.1